MSRRIASRRDSFSSSPMTKSSSTTPSSATARTVWASVNSLKPDGPMASPPPDSRHGAQPDALEQRHGDYGAGAEDQDRRAGNWLQVFGMLARLGGTIPRTLKGGGQRSRAGAEGRFRNLSGSAPREASEGRQTPRLDRSPAKACLTLLPVRHTNLRRPDGSHRRHERTPAKPRLDVHLCAPRGFCAGVVRAIDAVEQALARYGPPVYVRHEIVHNKYVVESLQAERRGLRRRTRRDPRRPMRP